MVLIMQPSLPLLFFPSNLIVYINANSFSPSFQVARYIHPYAVTMVANDLHPTYPLPLTID